MNSSINASSSINMISAKTRFDVPIGGSENGEQNQYQLLLTSIEHANGSVEYVVARGRDVKILNGNSPNAALKFQFNMDFVVRKLFYHTFKSNRHIEKQQTNSRKDKKTSKNAANFEESAPKERQFLVICGEHRLLFISVVDYHFYHYEIPFKLRNVFSVNDGILIERFYDATNEQTFHCYDTFHLYSLSGPFGELLPVIYKTVGFQPQWKFCWQSHQDDASMIDTSNNYVVVFDAKENVHRIYISRETEEDEVQSAIKSVESQRKQHFDSTLYAQSTRVVHTSNANTPQQVLDNVRDVRSPAMVALSEVINSEIEGRSPHGWNGFGHSTPNANAVYQGTLPTPVFEGASDSKIWSPTPGTPRMNVRTGAKNLERNLHARSIIRKSEQIPTTSNHNSPFSTQVGGTFNGSSSHFRTPTFVNNPKWRQSQGNAELLRDFTRMIRDTPRRRTGNAGRTATKQSNNVDFGELERDPDLDLLLSKISLECVYTEPRFDALPKCSKIFTSRCLTQFYLNLMSAEASAMKIIPIWSNPTTTKRQLACDGEGNAEISQISCKDSTFLEKSGLTLVLDATDSLVLYGGTERISMIFVKGAAEDGEGWKLHSYVGNGFIKWNQEMISRIEMPASFENPMVTEIMRQCWGNVEKEIGQNMYRKWVGKPKKCQQINEIEECRNVLQFLMESIGILISRPGRREDSASPDLEVGGKHMKPRQNTQEIMERMREYLKECGTRWERNQTIDQFNCELLVEVRSGVEEGEGFDLKIARKMLFALHCLVEEWRIDTLLYDVLPIVVRIVYILARICNETGYIGYYERKFKKELNETSYNFVAGTSAIAPQQTVPFDLLAYIGDLYECQDLGDLPDLPQETTKNVIRLLLIIAVGSSHIHNNNIDLELRLWLGTNWKKRIGLNAKTGDGLRKILNSKDSNGAEKATSLMRLFGIEKSFINRLSIGIRILLLKYQAEAYDGMRGLEPKECAFMKLEEHGAIHMLRWKHDLRVKNVEVMMDTSKPVLIAVNVLTKDADANIKEIQDRLLVQTAIRYFAQSIGRSVFLFRSEVPNLLQPITVCGLKLGGMLYPARVTCDPPGSEVFRYHAEWADFFNSTSTALQMGGSDTVKIDYEWMLMAAKSHKSTAVVAGLTFGFGLNGHLETINMYHAHQMLSTFDRFHSVALLLGLAASKFQTCDTQIYKILATYLPFLMGPTNLEIKLDCTVQTAAISALGLLFADSGNMNIAKKLANEIGKAPNTEDEPVSDRVAYKLSAGFSLGLIMLGKGNGVASTAVPFKQKIPHLSERLLCMMKGGLKKHCVFLPQSHNPIRPEANALPFSTGPGSSQTPNHVQESENVNIHLSSQSATIALGLMFMKTNNEFIAGQLQLPDSVAELEKIRPDLIFTRVLAYCLVMWDSIENSIDWVENRVPPFILRYVKNSLTFHLPGSEFAPMTPPEHEHWDEIVDRHTLAQTYLYAVSAGCFAMALKFSGDCSPIGPANKTMQALLACERFMSMVVPEQYVDKRLDYKRMAYFAGKSCVSMAFSQILLAKAVLRVSTGDKNVLRYARLLRSAEKLEKDSWGHNTRKHHEQVAAHQAMGLLFLGGGRFGLKKDNVSIALTVISLFPVMPNHIADNTHYHQPLRYLWVLATQPRLLVPFDVSEQEVAEADITVTMKAQKNGGKQVYQAKGPFLLPPIEEIESVEVGGDAFDVVRINLNTEEEIKAMEEILTIGMGKIKLKRFNTVNDASDEESFEIVPVSIDDIMDEDYVTEFDEEEFDILQKKMEKNLELNNAKKYPEVQMHLSSYNELLKRTTEGLENLQIDNISLTQKIVEGWSDEINLAQKLEEITRDFRIADN